MKGLMWRDLSILNGSSLPNSVILVLEVFHLNETQNNPNKFLPKTLLGRADPMSACWNVSQLLHTPIKHPSSCAVLFQWSFGQGRYGGKPPNLVKSGLKFEEIGNDVSTRYYIKRIWDFTGSLYNIESMEFSIETAEVWTCYVFHALTLLSLIKLLNAT